MRGIHHRNKRYLGKRAAYLEFLEARMMLSVSFAPGAMSGNWSVAGMGTVGTIQFDDANNVTGGSLTDTQGDMSTPSGNYTIDSGGNVTLMLTDGTVESGTMDSSEDMIVVTGPVNGNSDTLTVLTRQTDTTFAASDLSGTWALFVNGDDSSSTGEGTFVFDGNGNVTGGGLVTTDGKSTVLSGNYTVSSAGVTVVNIAVKDADQTVKDLSFTGQLNAGMDALAFTPTDIADSNTGGKLTLAIKSSGNYTDASLNGTWGMVGDNLLGAITFNGSGKIMGGGGTSGDGAFTASGSYSVSSSGALTVTIQAAMAGGNRTFTYKGTLNGSDTLATLETAPSANSGDSLLFLVDPNNHAPTLTSVTPLALAAAGQPFSFTSDFLLGNSNAADADGDALSVVITGLGTGTLAVNGQQVSDADLPLTLASADTLTWTAPVGESGTLTAFSVKVSDGTLESGTAVAVPINTVVTNGYSDADMNGTWGLSGTGFTGTVEFSGGGNISGGLLVDSNGDTDTPSGPYSVTEAGELQLTGGNVTSAGAIDSAKDVAATSEQGATNFDVLVNSSSGDFADADVAGTWTFAYDGAEGDSNGVGTVTFDAAGNVTGGTASDGSGNSTITGGNYSIASDGVISFTLTVRGHSGNVSDLSFQGHMNNSRDFAALDPADLQTASTNNDATLFLMVKSSGNYSAADLNGTWVLDEAGGFNAVTFDGKGKVSANGNSLGTYAVSSAGKVTITVGTEVFVGAMNKGKNALVVNTTAADGVNGELLFLNTADHAPTVNASGSFTQTAFVGSDLTLTYNQVIAAMGASDLDGNPLTIDFTAATQASGCLTIVHDGNRSAVGNGTQMVSGDTLDFGPAKAGKVTLFSANVSDGALTSGISAVSMNVIPLPTVTATATVATAEEALVGSASGDGVVTLTRSGGVTTQSLTVTLSVSGTAAAGTNYVLKDAAGNVYTDGSTVTFTGNQTTFKLNVVPVLDAAIEQPLTIDVGVAAPAGDDESPLYAIVAGKSSATVTEFDAAPTVTVAAGTATIKEGGAETFTFTRTPGKGGSLTGVTTTVDFNFTASTFDTDDINAPQPEAVMFLSGQTSIKYTVTTANDGVANPTETMVLTETGSTFVIGGTGTATVNVLDEASTISVAATKPKASELNPTTSGQGLFTFTRSGGDLSGPLTVNFSLSGTAANGTDYQSVPTSVTFTQGKPTATVAITPLDDQLLNGNQTVTANITGNAAYRVTSVSAQQAATVTITDVRIPPATLAGVTIASTISGGTGNFAKSGSYTLIFSPSTNSYVKLGAGSVPTSTGTFTYTVTGSTTATISLDDSIDGQAQALLVFSSATAATFTYTVNGEEGAQTGKMTGSLPPATQVAVASIGGRTMITKPSSSTGVFVTNKGSELIFSQNSDNFVMENIPSPGVSSGTYSYSVFSKTLGIVTYTDSLLGDGTLYVLFSSATAGSFVNVASTGDSQHGTISVSTLPATTLAAAAVTGDVIGLNVTGGISPYPKSGNATVTYTDTAYTIKDTAGTTIDSGNYTYEQYTPTIGIFTKNDASFGEEIQVCTFTSANIGTYLSLNVAGTADQTGRFGIA